MCFAFTQHACSVLNVDVISFDLSERVMFQFKYNQIRQVYMHEKKQKQHRTFLMFAYLPLVKTLCFQAIERGIYFEICYSPAIRGECNVHTLKQ